MRGCGAARAHAPRAAVISVRPPNATHPTTLLLLPRPCLLQRPTLVPHFALLPGFPSLALFPLFLFQRGGKLHLETTADCDDGTKVATIGITSVQLHRGLSAPQALPSPASPVSSPSKKVAPSLQVLALAQQASRGGSGEVAPGGGKGGWLSSLCCGGGGVDNVEEPKVRPPGLGLGGEREN